MVHEVQIILDYEAGLHLRPAMLVVSALQAFEAEVVIVCNGKEADARSILKLMELCAVHESGLTIRGEGRDAEQACQAVVRLIRSRFSEGVDGD